jgi:excisionase family DNA binding protein
MPDLLSTQEAAARLGVSPRRVVALIDTGRLPAIRVGRSWVIRAADLAQVADRPNGWPKGRRRKPVASAE